MNKFTLILCFGLSLLTGLASASSGVDRFKQISNIHNTHSSAHINSLAALPIVVDNSSYHYLCDKTRPFLVESLPEFNFDIGELYSGSVPIGNSKNRTLFFAYVPTSGPKVEEVTIWLSGGPGCSSLFALMEENGPFKWQYGVYEPVKNPYSWNRLTNVLYIEYPTQVGFSIGKPMAHSEEEISAEFIDWFKNWLQLFEIQNYKIYITGESYAGRYVPYLAQAMLNKKDKKNFDVAGAMIYDPLIGSAEDQFDSIIAPFVMENNGFLNLNTSTLATIQKMDVDCKYKAYRDKWFKFPPPGNQPMNPFKYPPGPTEGKCDIWDLAYEAAVQINPCFDVYQLGLGCPYPFDPLGFPYAYPFMPKGVQVYFDRQDVKKAIHAPLNIKWEICSNTPGIITDDSPDSNYKALPQVIEATNRVLIASGNLDMILPTNGTLFAIQNMTWAGKIGFQKAPNSPVFIEQPDLEWGIPGPQGTMGIKHFERGLMWSTVFGSGHMVPMSQPRVSFRHLQWLLRRIDDL